MTHLAAAAVAFALAQAPAAVAVEAEDFTVTAGWKVVKNGEGNRMVDIIGFNHVSGERLLHLGARARSGTAHKDITVPAAGDYRLWVRYEYASNTSAAFRVKIEQGGKAVQQAVMGRPGSPRYSFGAYAASGQNDMPYGPEGLHEEVITVRGLKAGPARITLEGEDQQDLKPGYAADRNIDLIYLSPDLKDGWYAAHKKRVSLYPILEAFRDAVGPRWEVNVTNKGAKTARVGVFHAYNRLPWGFTEPAKFPPLEPGKGSGWVGLLGQDTSHSSLVTFSGGEELVVELRPVGATKVSHTFSGARVRVYVPPYPGKGDEPITPNGAIDRVLAALKTSKAPGKVPTRPLCYGGWMPLGEDSEYGRKYAQLYAALGFRSLHPAHSGPKVLENLAAAGVPATKSWMVMGYRNPPTKANIDRARLDLVRRRMADKLRFFDYGDEIGFSEWLGMLLAEEVAASKAAGKPITAEQALRVRWITWLNANRRDVQVKEYWLPGWGDIVASKLRPDSSAEAAKQNPRLYVDSLLFYEEQAIEFAARGRKDVKEAFGDDVLCGANYSCHPFYYPSPTMYIKWFRGGAADLGRHSEYFWQVGQPGPMINGYVAEHFRCGMRDNPRAVLRQYTMPHAPGNTDANFVRSCFTHLAHGATMLDFFGIGMNETFTENHIDHRAVSRYRAMRDVTHCVGFVEDLLPDAKPVPSKVALLVSESTERWDMAAIATDRAGHAHFSPDFKKTRLHFHLDRLGLWKALTFAGHSPDLVTEQDVIDGKLGGASLLIAVGDHWPVKMVEAMERWAGAGGTVLATADAGMYDEYHNPSPAFRRLAGVSMAKPGERHTFLRPRVELPRTEVLATVVGDGWTMPMLATAGSAPPDDGTAVVAKWETGQPGMTERKVGKGKVVFVAAHPGLAYLYTGLQPPVAPDRGPTTHSIPTEWDAGAGKLLARYLGDPPVRATPALIDARLLQAKRGYLLPLASYTGKVAEKVTLEIRFAGEITRVTSAHHGLLKSEPCKGKVTVTIPSLTYGDVLRLE